MKPAAPLRLVVTGSSSGIGHALTLRLLQAGHEVWGLARSEQGALVAGFPDQFHAIRCDVSDWDQVERAARESAAAALDGLITCAGIQGEIGRTVTADPRRWAATVRTNLDGTFHVIRAFWPALLRSSRRAKVICFSGGGSTKARPQFSAYGAAKTAIVRLVETIAAEEAAARVDVNAIAPGAIWTQMTEEVLALGPQVVGQSDFQAAQRQQRDDPTPMNRALDLVEWLLSPASDGISGRLISAPWDPWRTLDRHAAELAKSDIYTLRRITPEERGQRWTGLERTTDAPG